VAQPAKTKAQASDKQTVAPRPNEWGGPPHTLTWAARMSDVGGAVSNNGEAPAVPQSNKRAAEGAAM